MNLEQLIQAIHYFNNLFHLGQFSGDDNSTEYFRKKKNEYQLELLEKFKDQIILEDDGTEGMFIIKIANSSLHGCHIPQLLTMDNKL